MSTGDGPDRQHDPTPPPADPTAPTPSTPADSPLFQSPSFETPQYEPVSYEPVGYEPVQYDEPPAWNQPSPSTPYLPPAQDQPYPPEPDQRPQQDEPTYAAQVPYPEQPQYASPNPDYAGADYANPNYADPGYPAPQYTAPPGYQPGAPLPVRTSRRAPLMIAIALVAVVVAALAAVGIVLATRGGDDRPRATTTLPTSPTSPTPTSTTSGAPATGSPSPGTTPTDVSQITVPAVTAGFQGVLSYKENVAYDVPAGWKIETPGTLVGFEDNDGKPVAIMHGVSTYKPGACPDVSGSNRGNTGFATAGTLAPAVAAQRGVKLFADGAALNEDGTTAPVTTTPVVTIRIGQGTIAAKMATATVSPPASAPCGASKVLFTSVAFRTTGGTALFIMYLDQGTPDALSPTLAKQIISSIRPYTG